MSKINAIVTGASRGIGSAIAIKLKESGYNVIGTSTTGNGNCEAYKYFTYSVNLRTWYGGLHIARALVLLSK